MKKLTNHLRVLIAIAIMLSVAMPTIAHDFEVDGIYYKYLDKTAKTVEVTYSGYYYDSYSNEYTGAVSIPSSVTYNSTTYSVISIGSSAFYGCSGLTSVTIGNSITEIGFNAFYGCTGLTSVTIPNSVTSIGSSAFYGCSGLTEVNITDLSAWCKIDFVIDNSNPLYYAQMLKLNGSEITNLVIPNDIIEIKNNAFCNCDGLTSVTIPNSVNKIGGYAFYNCEGLTSVTIPNSVTSIGNYAFYGTAWYNKFADGVLYINNVLYEYKGSMPNGTSISVKDGTVSISPFAFCNCTGLTSITIPNSVTSIGGYAFYNCEGLTSVTIPNSVTSIGSEAFSFCRGLTEVNFNAENCTSMKSLSYSVFNNCSNLKTINIGNNVKTIPNYAFAYCTGLTSVTIPNSVTSIGSVAFAYCTGLTSVTIPNSVTEIGVSAFYNCEGLTSVTIPNSVTSIGSSAFYGCSGLTEVNFNAENCTSMGSLSYPVFNNCSNLKTINIGNNVKTIPANAFYNCSGLTSITISNSVTEIGDKAFYGCSKLKTIVSLNPTPPTCASSKSFYSYSAILYVPKDSFAKYFIDEVWGMFSNIKKIETTATSILLNKSSISFDIGATETIKATISPSNTTLSRLCWTSDNSAVATVDQSGKITAISAGTAKITAMAIDGSNVSASCNVTVNAVEIETQIVLSQTEASLPVNDIMTLTYTVANSTNKTATWSTSNANVAPIKVNSDGSVTVVGLSDGVATITATANDGSGASASCVVTVGVGGIEGVEVDDNAIEVARYDIHGRLLSEPARGINIVKYSDGSTRKEFVK